MRCSWLTRDPPTTEDRLRQLKERTSTLVLIQEESWIDLVAVPARWVPLDADAKRTFAFDEAGKEPARFVSASESFLLIVRTRHIFTIASVQPNVKRPVKTRTMSSAGCSDIPAYSRIL